MKNKVNAWQFVVALRAIRDYINNRIPNPPDDNGSYVLKCIVNGDQKTYEWVKELQ